MSPAGPVLVAMLLSLFAGQSLAADWPQFRGPGGTGISQDPGPPATWSDSQNLRWKTPLPGLGSSSPIVWGDRVFVTCYSGYGESDRQAGDPKALERQLVCINRSSGKIRWQSRVPADLPEDGYQGYLTEHGYASSTPVTDGQRVYCFFGKTGMLAFDFEGRQLWQTGLGKESSNRRWGSAASPILYKNLVIVNAAEESQSIRALDQATGNEVWKASASALELAYDTPSLVTLDGGLSEVVISVPGEIWGLNPDTGKLRWFAEHRLTGNICPSVIVDGEMLYAFGGFRSAGSLALRAGGKGDVSSSRLVWSSRESSYVATPLLHEGHLYWIDDRGQAFCVAAKSGELVYRERVAGLGSGGRPVYASPVLVGNKIYVQTRWNGVLVLAAKPEYQLLGQNRFAGDDSDANATPAISGGEMFLRSNQFLYCVADSHHD